jgi:hypothetical protein
LDSSPVKKSNQPISSIQILSEQDLKFENQILAFKIRMTSSFKSTDSISVDSTIWYLELTANYTYGNGTAENENVAVDTTFIEIPVANEEICMDDVNDAYNDLIDSVRIHYYSIDSVEKHLLSVQVRQVSLTEEILNLKIISTIVFGPYTGNFTFQPWENWWYGMGLGMCNNQNQGMDAASEIARRIMLRKEVPVGYFYYEPYSLNPVMICADFYPVPGIPPSNFGSHYMWWEDSNLQNFHLCIPYNELNFYLTGTEYVIYNIEKPAGYSFMSVSELEGSLILNSTIWVHFGEVNYGILHQSNQPPEEL